MTTALWEKIEAIRKEPEHVRRRYVTVCVSVSMVFIFGIWLLSLGDTIATTVKDLPKGIEKGKSMTTDGTPSLNDLFQQSAPLRIEGKSEQGGQFFNQQMNGGVPESGS